MKNSVNDEDLSLSWWKRNYLFMIVFLLAFMGCMYFVISSKGTTTISKPLSSFDSGDILFSDYNNMIFRGNNIISAYRDLQGKPYAIVVKNSDYEYIPSKNSNKNLSQLGINYNAELVLGDNVSLSSDNEYSGDLCELLHTKGVYTYNNDILIDGVHTTISDYVKLDKKYKSILIRSFGYVIGVVFEEIKE